MRFTSANKLHGKSGGMGHPDLLQVEVIRSQSLGMTILLLDVEGILH
jgi:hypothetical protein